MKKLIIAAAIVCAAAFAQAATTAWNFIPQTTILDTTGVGSYSGAMAVYVFAKDATFDKTAALDSWNVTASEGTFDSGDVASNVLVANTTYSFYLYAETTVDSKDYVYIGTKTNKKALETGRADVSLKAGSWEASAVPEPTSGLLMLLGFAGLALRRKLK